MATRVEKSINDFFGVVGIKDFRYDLPSELQETYKMEILRLAVDQSSLDFYPRNFYFILTQFIF